jgi:hypothetical protein
MELETRMALRTSVWTLPKASVYSSRVLEGTWQIEGGIALRAR